VRFLLLEGALKSVLLFFLRGEGVAMLSLFDSPVQAAHYHISGFSFRGFISGPALGQ
jgi:hypothetical protein